jgi:hypothetical protein
MLRSEVGRNITARLTPSLEFVLDALPETSAHLEDLLAKAKMHDVEVAKAAKNARSLQGMPTRTFTPVKTRMTTRNSARERELVAIVARWFRRTARPLPMARQRHFGVGNPAVRGHGATDSRRARCAAVARVD